MKSPKSICLEKDTCYWTFDLVTQELLSKQTLGNVSLSPHTNNNLRSTVGTSDIMSN